MITKASDLLGLFIEEERRKLEGIPMPHMPTLGSAYEEITKQGLDQNFVLPTSLDLRVVSGFVKIDGQMQNEQIDCMLVVGDGERYGITNQYIYTIEKVLCIFEVKKTLAKRDYIDALGHLGKIRRTFSKHFEKKLEDNLFDPDVSHARKIFSQITGKTAPERYSDIHVLSETDGILFHTLVQEQHAPISVIHGYGGYKTEEGLRTAFIDVIDEQFKIESPGFGVPGLPSLVTSNNFCLVKGNGQPYIAVRSDGLWAAILSTRHNPAKLLLELIWFKISSYFNVAMPYGPDLDDEPLVEVLMAEPRRVGEKVGWVYTAVERKEKSLYRDEKTAWAPLKVEPAEMAAINLMVAKGGCLPLDCATDEYLRKTYNRTADQVACALVQSRAFAKDGNYLRPIENQILVLTNEDESGYVASDLNRFDAWCEQHSIAPQYMRWILLDDST
jgi:hypothetical protein